MATRLDAKTLEFLLSNVDMSSATPEMQALVTETKENAAAEIAKLQLAQEREFAAAVIKANLDKIVVRDYSPLTIPACVSAVLITFAWNTETAVFERTKRGVVPSFIGDAPSDELLYLISAIDEPENHDVSSVIDLDTVLLDDAKDFVMAVLGSYPMPALLDGEVQKELTLNSGQDRYNAIMEFSSWPAALEILSELSTSIAGVENGAVFSDEQATVEIVYNSAAVNKEKNGNDDPIWYVNIKIGKGSAASSGNGRKKGPRTKVPGYKRNADYAMEFFVGEDKEHYDKVLTDLVKQWGIPSSKYNMTNELVRIEKSNPDGPQLYTQARETAQAVFDDAKTDPE